MAQRPELTSGNKDVAREAFERKEGGKVPELKTGGKVAKANPFKDGGGILKRKRGGKACVTDSDKDGMNTGGKVVAKLKEGGKIEGKKSGGRLDKFARGGKVGSDKNPYSSAKID